MRCAHDMSAPPPIQAVIFDMDGVLTDSEPLINAAAIAMFREKGFAVRPEDFLPFVGTGEDRYIGGVAELHKITLDVKEAKKRTYEIYLSLVPERLQAFEGAVSLVWACRQAGLRMAVASSADLIKIEANLRKIGLPPEFWEAVVSADDVVDKKPAPDIFLAAARKLNVPPVQCTVVEDAINGVQAAKAAGMRCVAVAQTFEADQLREADLVKPRIAELTVDDLVKPNPAAPLNLRAGPPGGPPETGSSTSPSNGKRVWGFWATIGFSFLIAAGVVGSQVPVGVIYGIGIAVLKTKVDLQKLTSNGLFLALATTVSTPVGLSLAWIFAAMRKGLAPSLYLGLIPVRGREMLRGCLSILIVVIMSDALTWVLKRPIIPDFMRDIYATAGFLPLLWLVLVVFAPIGEEILFRGFLFQGLLNSAVRAPGAILISSLCWAGIHLQYDFYGITMVFVVGLLLGWTRLKTGSVYPCIAMHALMNLLATVEVELQQRFKLFLTGAPLWILCLGLISGGLVCMGDSVQAAEIQSHPEQVSGGSDGASQSVSSAAGETKPGPIQPIAPIGDDAGKPLPLTPWLGVFTEEASDALAAQLGLDPGIGLVVVFVSPGSPAEAAGLKKNDLLVECGGQSLVHPAQLRKLVRVRKEGDAVEVVFYRAGKKETRSITLTAARKDTQSLNEPLPSRKAVRKLEQQIRDLPVREAIREEMDAVRESLKTMQQDHSKARDELLKKVQNEVRRGVEQARKAAREAVRTATNAPSTLEPLRKKIEDMAESGMRIGKDTLSAIQNGGSNVSSLVKTDNSGSVVILSNPKRHLTAHDSEGKLLFDGPIETQAQRDKVPPEVWKKVEPLLKEMQGRGPGEAEQPEKE